MIEMQLYDTGVGQTDFLMVMMNFEYLRLWLFLFLKQCGFMVMIKRSWDVIKQKFNRARDIMERISGKQFNFQSEDKTRLFYIVCKV